MPTESLMRLASERVIVALDAADDPAARRLVARLPAVRFWKVGLELFTACGPALVEALRQRDCRVFLDLKFHDIPNTVAGACRSAAALGVDLLTVHASGGSEMIRAAVEATHTQAERLGRPAPKILAVTLLTSLAAEHLRGELQVELGVRDYVLRLAELAVHSGAQGLVCSGLEVQALRSFLGSGVLLVTPGIRCAAGDAHDQQRVLDPKTAILLGSDYLVVGRAISAAPDPAAAFEAVVSQIAECVR
jgi:orotidine-5'-phosphate decarboxylase